MLLYGSEKQLGIYQITARDPEHDYRFMGLDFVQKKGMTVARADYDLIYTAPLTEKETLDSTYERFNIQRPADFTGHSLSVSDVVVLNDGSTVKAYYVDSIGFAELPDFFKERNMDLQKENLLKEKLQEIEIFDKPGLFSNGRLRDEDVPEGLYRYDLRGSDYDPGQPITVEKTVVVNHAASVLMAEELDLGADGRLELGEDGLNFTGAELTVRKFMEEQQQKRNGLIHGDSDHIAVEGHLGTWYAVDETEIGGEKFFLLEHEEHGDMAACVAVDEQGKLVAEDLWNGFDDEFLDAVKEYLSEKWNMPNKDDVVSEIIEKAAPVPDNSAQDYSDVPVYYEPFSYAKENDNCLIGHCKHIHKHQDRIYCNQIFIKPIQQNLLMEQLIWHQKQPCKGICFQILLRSSCFITCCRIQHRTIFYIALVCIFHIAIDMIQFMRRRKKLLTKRKCCIYAHKNRILLQKSQRP